MACVALEEYCLDFGLVRDSSLFDGSHKGALSFISNAIAGDFDFKCYIGDYFEFMMVVKMSLRFAISQMRFKDSV